MDIRMSNIASPMPQIRAKFTNKLGIPLSGCKVYTYEPNSDIPKTTWLDADKTTENTNPILLDAAGEADIFLNGLYRVVVKDRFGFVVYDVEKTGIELDASFVVSASGETQQDINDYTGAKWRNKVGGYELNARVILENGDIVKSTVAGNTVNPNVDMTGWVFDSTLLIEYFGAKENSENSDAIQAAFDYLRLIGGGSLSTNIKKMSISKRCVYHDKTTVDFNNCNVTLTGTGQICSALYNSDRTAFTSMLGAEIYYKYQATRNINNPNSRITTDANKTAQSIIVESSTGFNVGDYVLVSNGYCDMWRVMEQYQSGGLPASRSSQDWVRPDVDLWRCEIMRIKSISGTTIVFEDRLENDYKAIAKTYGFFSDENNRADHQTWNHPFIERLGGASNCKFKNIIVNNQGSAEVAILGYGCVNNTVLDSQFYGNGQGVDFVSCFNSHVLRSHSDTKKFGQSIRRGSQMCILADATAKYVSGDCPLIIWEGANHCIANNLNIDGTGGDVNHTKIGFYFNTCWNNVASNIVGKNLSSVVGVMFCRGGNLTTGISGTNCGNLLDVHASFEETAANGVLNGTYKDTPSIYDASLCSVSECNNIEISKLKSFEKYSATKNAGRLHIFKSFAVNLNEIEAENVILWNSTDDDKKYEPSKYKMKVSGSRLKSMRLIQTYANGEAQTRRSYIKDTDFIQFVSIENTHNTEFKGVEIMGLDITTAVTLTISAFTRFIDSVIKSNTTGINFRGAGNVGTEAICSQIYMSNTSVEAPTKFSNYIDPMGAVINNTVHHKSMDIKYISGLSEYPALKTFANPSGDGNSVGWYLVDSPFNGITRSFTTADLSSASHSANNSTRKWLGCEVYNTTVGKFMKATGRSATSSWVSTDGLTTITPV